MKRIAWLVFRAAERVWWPMATGYWLAQAVASVFMETGPDWRAWAFTSFGLIWLVMELNGQH